MDCGQHQSALLKTPRIEELNPRALKVKHVACGHDESMGFGDCRDEGLGLVWVNLGPLEPVA